MSARCVLIIGLSVILGGAAQEEPGKTAQKVQQLDLLGRLNVASGFARVGGYFEAAIGNPGCRVDLRNWDPSKSVKKVRGFVSFGAGTDCFISGIRAYVPDKRLLDAPTIDPKGSGFRLEAVGLDPGETLRLEITLSSLPRQGYAVSFDADY